MLSAEAWHARFAWGAFALALILYPTLLWHYIRANAPVFDEAEHIAAGYRYWQCGDYGINPEHPPLAKLVAAAPIRGWKTEQPEWPCGSRVTTNSELIGVGYRMINGNLSLEALRASRQATIVFPILLIVTLFFAARAWFGPLAAGIAVLLAVFEPNLTAHGPLVTTDMALTATTLLTLFAAWRYWQKPSLLRLLCLGVAMGLALASKHSGVLVPLVVLLAFVASEFSPRLWRLLLGWLAACILAMLVLWSTYQFRFDALPGGHGPAFDMAQAIQSAGVAGTPAGWLIAGAAKHRLVPESYLAGLLWVKANSARETYFFGRQLPAGVWYYFPVAILIKTPLALLVLL
ncbi:MAG TPA: glycosyltransferase family 39 protein, partial [Bryobacteraceae bacterium]